MFRELSKAIIGLAVIGIAPAANAVTYTGAELFALPSATFPTVGTTVIGTSLRFDPVAVPFQKLFVLPLAPATSYAISLNFTRLAKIGVHPVDHDPHFVISDGANMVGIAAADGNNPTPGTGPNGIGELWTDDGALGNWLSVEPLFYGAAYPDIGADFTVETVFTLSDAGTSVFLSFGGQSGIFDTPVVLSLLSPLHVSLVGDNNLGETYQLNWISIEVPAPIPLPAALPLFATTIVAMALVRRRRR